MKKKLTVICLISICVLSIVFSGGCSISDTYSSQDDTEATVDIANRLQENQPTPTDIDYSLERYNLIRRTYWVNGQREKANSLICEIEKPLGYIVLMTDNGAIVGSFVVDGKVSSLNSFLTPDSEFYEQTTSSYNYGNSQFNEWLADVDGSYGENDDGIFFFTVDGNYVEWTGLYLYSDIPMHVDTPVVNYSEVD